MKNTIDTQKPTLLVVDDEASVRMPLNYAFKEQYNIFLCSNSEEAMSVVANHRVHVAILDIKMANESGLDLLVDIKKADPFIEVIMLTGFGTMEYMKSAWDNDAFAFARKPFDIAELTQMLERAVRLRRSTEAAQAAMEKAKLVDSGMFEIQAGVIHDLRNILTSPMGVVDLLVSDIGERTHLSEEEISDIHNKLSMVNKQLQTCGTLCLRHLQVIRAATNAPQSVEGAGIDEITSELVASLQGNSEFKATRMRTVPAMMQLPRVPISPMEVYQMILNLVMNGAQASQRPHEVVLESRLRTAPLELEFMVDSACTRVLGKSDFRNEAPFVVATVADTGDGIPAEILAKLFSGLHTTKKGGTGVGLSSIGKFIERNKCLLFLETKPGKGTSVAIYFPVGGNQNASPA